MFAKYIQNLYEISKKRKKKSFSKKNNKKGSSKSSQIECFNYGAKGNFATNFPTLERNKKTMHVTWSMSINNETTSSTNSEDNNALFTLTISLISPKKLIVLLNYVMRKKFSLPLTRRYIMPCIMRIMKYVRMWDWRKYWIKITLLLIVFILRKVIKVLRVLEKLTSMIKSKN